MTFKQQSEWWIESIQTRKRNPVKPSSVAAFRSHLNWLQPRIGGLELADITNRTLKELVPQIAGSPKTISCYLATVKAVVASALDENGEQIYKREWNSDFIDAPIIGNQNTPTFTSSQVAEIVARGNGTGVLFKVAAGTGLRIGELLALQPRHLKGRTITVEQSQWNGTIQTPKTVNGFREVDLPVALAHEMSERLGGRLTGFIFEKPRTYGDALQKLHGILDGLKIEPTGFHAFRRFRKTHLGKMRVPRDLTKYWLGHADSDVTDSYDKIEQDVEFRLAEAERAGLGF